MISPRPVWKHETGIPDSDLIIGFALPHPPNGLGSDPSVPGGVYAAAENGTSTRRLICSAASDSPPRTVGRQRGEPADPTRTGTSVRAIAVNALDQNRLYLLGEDEAAASADGGATWTIIDGTEGARLSPGMHGLCPPHRWSHAVRGGRRPGQLVSTDEGRTWRSFLANLPTVSVQHLLAQNRLPVHLHLRTCRVGPPNRTILTSHANDRKSLGRRRPAADRRVKRAPAGSASSRPHRCCRWGWAPMRRRPPPASCCSPSRPT